MREVMKKFRNFQDEVFGSGCNAICNVETYRNGEDYAIDFSVFFSETKERMCFSWSSWAGAVSDLEEFKEQVRAKL